MGLLGLAPYLATSVMVLVCSWEIEQAGLGRSGLLMTPETAKTLLGILEPTQIGLGAVIISFLGAIHWGLEFAGYGGHQGYRRYLLGIAAPIFAWPTIYLPTDAALITQFLGFTLMWFADSSATNHGWTPRWYTSYRFFLTFIVGGCILMTLVGRGRSGAGEGIPNPQTGLDNLHSLRQEQWKHITEDPEPVLEDLKEDQGKDTKKKDKKK